MGRTRTFTKPGPKLPRFYLNKGHYWHVTTIAGSTKRNWHDLGVDYAEAITEYAQREGSLTSNVETFDDLEREFILECIPTFSIKTQLNWVGKDGTSGLMANLRLTFTGVKLKTLKAHHLYSHMDKRAKEGSYISGNREATLFKTMCNLAVRRGWLDFNPFRDVKKTKEFRRTRYLTDAEFNAIRAKATPLVEAIMCVDYQVGLRVSDLLGLKMSDIADGYILVEQQKNEVSGKYVLDDQLKALIARAQELKVRPAKRNRPAALRPTQGFVFETMLGKPYTYYGFRSNFERARKKAGVPDVHFHDIRAKAITDAVTQGRKAQSFSLHKTEAEAEAYVKLRQVPVVVALALPTVGN
jgi:integrase